jgi:hypothetical protein
MEQYNFSTQFQVRKNMSLMVAYVGNYTVHGQLNTIPENVPNPGPGAVQSRRPYPQRAQLAVSHSNGIGRYNALQATLEKRSSPGVYAPASYSYSKCTDNGTSEPSR